MTDKTQNADSDFTLEAVPQDRRLPAVQVFSIWIGFILVVGIMAVGGGLAAQLQKGDFVLAVVIGNIVLALFAAFTGYVGAKTGMAFNQMVRTAFPGKLGGMANLYVPVVLVGWYAVEAALFGSFVAQAFGLSEVAERIVMLLSALFFATSSYIGFRGLKWVSYVMVPLILVLGSYAVLAVLQRSDLTFAFGEPITLSTGVSFVIASWIMGVLTSLPDLTRFCRKPIYGALVGGVGILVANSFNLIIGGYGASLSQQSDPALILYSLGFVVAGLIFSLANIWTTNDSNMYSASLNLSSLTGVSRRNCVLICTFVGAILAAFDPAKLTVIFTFLIFMGNTAPALAGVVYTAWILRKPSYPSWCPWAAWALGALASWWAGGLWALPLGIIVSSSLLVMFGKIRWNVAGFGSDR